MERQSELRHRNPQKRAGPAAVPRSHARPSAAPGVSPLIAGLTDLQRAAGNQAVQRLMSNQAFKEKTFIKAAKRGKTVSELDRLLAKYHADAYASQAKKQHGVSQKRLGYLNQILSVADLWLDDHQEDTSRGVKHRRQGVKDLREDAAGELRAAGFRTPSSREGLKTSKYVAKREGSASSILEGVGKAIGLAIPKPGDSVEVALDTRIPCDSYGVSYVGFSIAASAARMDKKATWISFKAAVTGGAQVAGLANVGGELGVFLEAQGATPEQAMKLISYGWYRQLRESPVIPREIANFMWGGGTGSVGGRRAARWAANVEKEAFGLDPDDPNYEALSSGIGSKAVTDQFVRLGFGAGAGADVGGIAGSLVDVAGSVGVRGGKHYDRTSLANALGAHNIGKAQKTKKRFHTKDLSTGVLMFDVGFGAAFGPFSGDLAMALEIMFRTEGKKKIPESYVSLKGSLSATVPANAFLLNIIANGVKNLSNKLVANMGVLEKKAKDDKATKGNVPNLDAGGQGLSTALAMFPGAETDVTEDSIEGLKTLGQPAEEGGEEALGSGALGDKETWLGPAKAIGEGGMDTVKDPGKLLDVARGAFIKPVTLTLMMGGGLQVDKASTGWTFEISLSQGTGTSLQAGVAGLSFSKSSRLVRFVLSAGGGEWERKGKQSGDTLFGLTID